MITNQRINVIGRLNFIEELLKGPINKYKLRKFIRGTHFRHFFELVEECGFRDQQFPGNLVLKILVSEVFIDEQRDDELWFHLGGAAYRFGVQEFALVTRLRFGPIKKSDLNLEGDNVELPNDNIFTRVWPHKGGNVDPDDIMKALYYQKLAVEDVKRLILVVTVHRLFFGLAVKKDVSKLVWLLADDVKRLNRFAWGTLYTQGH